MLAAQATLWMKTINDYTSTVGTAANQGCGERMVSHSQTNVERDIGVFAYLVEGEAVGIHALHGVHGLGAGMALGSGAVQVHVEL
jgi:hypothetical protein